jgi:2-methylcitrate dehydratase PrpD
MWSIGTANSFEILIPSLGLDQKRFAVACAAAAASKGLSQKKTDNALSMSKTTGKSIAAFMKGPMPFSIAQLKEIGASLARNCMR